MHAFAGELTVQQRVTSIMITDGELQGRPSPNGGPNQDSQVLIGQTVMPTIIATTCVLLILFKMGPLHKCRGPYSACSVN